MSFKRYHTDLTAEIINKLAGIDHQHKKRKGTKGLSPKQFKKIIAAIDNSKTEILDSLTMGPWEFIKSIYHAVESKFPVILLFSHPSKKQRIWKKVPGHATALIGHTFNENNWWSYGLSSYFSSIKQPVDYLPSVLWCDKFIIQDDNLGPYYTMPLSSLRLSNLTSKLPITLRILIKFFKRYFLVHIIPFSYWPTYAIITYPKNSIDFPNCFEIESYAIEQLNQYVKQKVINTKYEPLDNIQFSDMLIHFMNESQLIARTYAIKKMNYFKYYKETYKNKHKEHDIKLLNQYIESEYIWITEVSVPELYWVNRKKIGDIISEPFKGKKNRIKYIRIPGHHCFFLKDFTIERESFKETDSRHPMLNSSHQISVP